MDDTTRTGAPGRPKVFVSYAREWNTVTERIYDQLATAGCDPWMDKRNLVPGQQWHETILEAIKNADVILVCVSRQFVEADRYLHKELSAARALVGPTVILPVRLEPEAHVPPELHGLEWDDFYLPGGMRRLLKAIASNTGALLDFPPEVFIWDESKVGLSDFSASLLKEMQTVCEVSLKRLGDLRLSAALGQSYGAISEIVNEALEPVRASLQNDIEVTCLDGPGRYVLHPWPSLVGCSFESQWGGNGKGKRFVEWFLGTMAANATGYAIWMDSYHSSQVVEREMARSSWRYRRKTAVLFSQVHVSSGVNWYLAIEGHEIAGIEPIDPT